MSDAAVVLICDESYLVPTFASALSARCHIKDDDVKVLVFVLGEERDWSARLTAKAAQRGIHLQWVSVPELEDLSVYHRDRYLPPITLARFWLDTLLPANIKRFLYIDGDVMVDDSLDELLEFIPPDDKIVAAPDNLQMFFDEYGRAIRVDLAYVEGLGVPTHGYFNAGVIYTSRRAWIGIVEAAVAFLRSRPDLCRSSDQSALNFAARGKVIMLSQRYNYQSEHMMVPRPSSQKVAIYHFTGGPKPWVSPDWPWNEYFNRFYNQALDFSREFNLPPGTPPVAQTEAGQVHRRRFRIRQKWLYPWRRLSRRRKLQHLLARSEAPV